MSEQILAIGDLAVTPLNAIPRRVKYLGETEIFLEDNDDPVKGEWVLRSFARPYTVGTGGQPEQTEDYSRVLQQEDIAKWIDALQSGKWPTISGQILLLEALVNTRQALAALVGAAFRLTEEGPIEVGEDWPEWACCGVRALNDSWHSTSCPYVATQEAIRQARTIAALPEEETEK